MSDRSGGRKRGRGRNVSRPTQSYTLAATWTDSTGRAAFNLHTSQTDEPFVCLVGNPNDVLPPDREAAAYWLSRQFPGLDHDDCYEFLWELIPALEEAQ